MDCMWVSIFKKKIRDSSKNDIYLGITEHCNGNTQVIVTMGICKDVKEREISSFSYLF